MTSLHVQYLPFDINWLWFILQELTPNQLQEGEFGYFSMLSLNIFIKENLSTLFSHLFHSI